MCQLFYVTTSPVLPLLPIDPLVVKATIKHNKPSSALQQERKNDSRADKRKQEAPHTAVNMVKLMVLVVFVAFSVHHGDSCSGDDAPVFAFEGDLQLTLLVRECNNSDVVYARTLVNSAIWTTERLNFLDFTGPLRLGLTAFKVCEENDYYNALFKVFAAKAKTLQLGVISDRKLTDKLKQFAGVLELDYEVTMKYWSYLVKASVRLVDALDLQENVTVVASREDVLMEFFRQSRKHWVCVQHCILME